MGIRDDILNLLQDDEKVYLARAEKIMGTQAFYTKVREFRVVYPDPGTWQKPFEAWLKAQESGASYEAELTAKRLRVKALEVAVAEKKHLSEGKFLDKRIAELEKLAKEGA